MQTELQKSSVEISRDIHTDFIKIFSDNLDKQNIHPFMKRFWQEQQKYLSSSKTGIRYHPMIIRYALNLAAKSPSAYEEIRYDENQGTGILILPSQRRLRDYKIYIKPERGFNKNIIAELQSKTQPFSHIEKNVILAFDEMKIQDNLVWDKHSGHLIGYVDLGDTEVNYATLKNADEIASHVLVFLIRGIVNPLKFVVANFATTSATAIQIFPLFWKAVGILEKTCGLNVIAASCDGASSNHKFFEMHRHFDSNSDRSRGDVVHKVLNPYFQDRYLYFIADPPHLIKTARNCLYKSGSPSGTRYMWNIGLNILRSHVSRFYYEDLEMGLHFLPKITQEHIQLNSFSIMNVRLAVQILSSSVAHVLREYGPPEAAGSIF